MPPAGGGDAARPTFRLGPSGGDARVYTTAITTRRARHGVVLLPPELDAGSLPTSRPATSSTTSAPAPGSAASWRPLQRGAAAVAFEPGFAAFKELCDNIILNGCGRAVVPVPAALTDRAGLRALTYPHAAGSDRHALRDREWRLGREAPADRYTQPVCAESLDELVRRQRLPPPQALRIAVRSGADAVLRGAAGVIATHRPRSILVLAQGSRAGARRARRRGGARLRRGRGWVQCGRFPAGPAVRARSGASPRPRPWGALRRAAGRVRARG